MSIIRAARPTQNFYVLDKRISEDKRLSWGARGLLIFLLGKPDNWRVSISALINETTASSKHAGRDAVYGLIRELIDAGYMTRKSGRGAAGEFGQTDYVVTETPEPRPAQPDTGLPDTVNPALVRTEGKQELKGAKNLCADGAKGRGELPDWIPVDAWRSYEAHLVDIGKALTPVRRKRAIAALETFRNEGHGPVDVIEQTILSGGAMLCRLSNGAARFIP